MIISHLYQKENQEWECQSNEEHSQGVAKRCEEFASQFGMGEWGKLLGLLHDKGKEQLSFQQHIKKESGYDTTIQISGDYRHAYVGALIAKKLYPSFSPIMANALMGHHRGLYDEGEMQEILKKKIPDDVHDENLPKMSLRMPPLPFQKEDLHLTERMLYSCLVDADYLDTESFMRPLQAQLRGSKTSMEALLKNLEERLDEIKRNSPDTIVNRIRNNVQQLCRKKSNGCKDFYSLTVPTGGGKTLSSVLWALHHAVKNQLDRIIIAIPYTSIIVQTANTLKDIFGDENVLEHHSNIKYDDNEMDTDEYRKIRLATENWNYPIIITTNVQLFKSLFSHKPSSCRKLHNIVNSVLILDEVQTLPIDFLQPIVNILDTLKRIFGCSILFTTASQPILEGEHRGTNYQVSFKGLPTIHEIIPADAKLHDKLKRVELSFNNCAQTYDEVAHQLVKFNKALCIVNTRRDAKELYERLPKEGLCIHLSRMMCPAHVRETIRILKDALKDPDNKVIRVVATQLIEAGVDIDFPVVFRQEAGLDSILQAAGRCNREGKLNMGTTYVFSLAREHHLPIGFITQTNNARKALGEEMDWFAPKTMEQYFEQLFCRSKTFDRADIANLLYKKQLQFETASKVFKMVDDDSFSIIINWRDSMEFVSQLLQNGITYPLMKKLSQYSINVRSHDFKKLMEAGAVEEILQGIYCVRERAFYHDDIGMITNNQWLEEILIR